MSISLVCRSGSRTRWLTRFLSTVPLETPLCPNEAAAEQLGARLRPLVPSATRDLIDEGALLRLKRRKKRILGNDEIDRLLRKATTEHEKHEVVVACTLLLRWVNLLQYGHCLRCHYPTESCVCNSLQVAKTKHSIYLYQHVGEFARSNNSGNLLCMLLGARRAIHGLREDAEQMLRHAEENEGSCIVLFPSADSISMAEFVEYRKTHLTQGEAAKPVTMFLPDGTSNQAKNLEKRLPAQLPRVRLSAHSTRSWLDPIRRQTESHRVCTAQAAAMALAEIGESEPTRILQDAVEVIVSRANAIQR